MSSKLDPASWLANILISFQRLKGTPLRFSSLSKQKHLEAEGPDVGHFFLDRAPLTSTEV
jgi:hypothetical protein